MSSQGQYGDLTTFKWVQNNFGTSDGTLAFQANTPEFLALDKGPTTFQLSSDFVSEYLKSEAPDTNLWEIQSTDSLAPVSEGDAITVRKTLGKPRCLLRWFSLVRIWSPWLAPRHGTTKLQLSEDGLLCSFLDSNGTHTVLLALNGINDTLTVFNSDDEGNVIVASRNDGSSEGRMRTLLATSQSFGCAHAAVMYAARKIVTNSQAQEDVLSSPLDVRTQSLDGETVLISKRDEIEPKWFENWYDGLAYCTWNSLGQNLHEDKIMHALESLDKEGVHVSNLIIDDNWQSLDGTPDTNQMLRGWTQFEANPEGFPSGLKSITTNIRSEYPYIKHIGVWHALLGYWGGISPSGQIAHTYKTKSVQKRSGVAGGTMLAVDSSDVHRFYNDFYTFLATAGIDSVKTDAQFFLDLLSSTADRRRFTTVYQDAWNIAHLRHFSAKVISCMSQVPQIMFHSLLPKSSPTILIRNSDDFFPDVPTSHPWHVFVNAHNALFIQYLNVLPDWDMFQTAHPYGAFHAAARCISGGPVYITDTPGQHDVPLIRQMTAKNPRGQTVILRPSCIGKTIDIYSNYNEGNLLKIGAYNGSAKAGTSFMGCFNIRESGVSALVPLRDFCGVEAGNSYIVGSFKTGNISQSLVMLENSDPEDPGSLIEVNLPTRGYDIFSVYPLHDFDTGGDKKGVISVALLGLLDKMTGAAALMNCDLFVTNPSSDEFRRLQMDVSLKALGTLGIYVSVLKDMDVQQDFMAIMGGKAVAAQFVKGSKRKAGDWRGGLLEIDVEGAWKALDLQAGWSNEVDIQVFMKL
ncbi:MAG: hypothetical protein Q9227_004928 [Pyrenula ochraceoflavens]